MLADTSPPEGLRATFDDLLTLAITKGCTTAQCGGLGPGTRAAIDDIAFNHPDAEASSIAAAYDAFAREHGFM